MQKRTIIAGLGITAALVVSGTTGAVASNLIGSQDIKDGGVHRIDLGHGVQHSLDQRAQDGIDGKDGVSNLIVGAGYAGLGAHAEWAANSYGETVETCPDGQYAIGGGFSSWGGFNGTHDGYDLGGLNKDVQITVSAPYFKGEYVPVDDAGNFRADQWVVRGFNHGDTPVDVRAWVVCADVS